MNQQLKVSTLATNARDAQFSMPSITLTSGSQAGRAGQKANGLESKAAFENEFNRKAKEARIAKEVYAIFDTDSEDDLERTPAVARSAPQKPTAVDQDEADELNEECKAKQSI